MYTQSGFQWKFSRGVPPNQGKNDTQHEFVFSNFTVVTRAQSFQSFDTVYKMQNTLFKQILIFLHQSKGLLPQLNERLHGTCTYTVEVHVCPIDLLHPSKTKHFIQFLRPELFLR